jgi:hypothetical protein
VAAVRTIYRYLAALVFVGVLVQVGAAGYGAFYVASKLGDKKDKPLDHKHFEHAWNFHTGFGYFLVIGILIMLVLGLIGRLGRPRIWLPVALAVAGVLQVIFAWIGDSVPALGFLHPINALAIFALAGANAHGAWRKVRAIG